MNNDGLKHILLHYGSNRPEVYCRLFGIMWYGNGVGKTSIDSTSGSPPTYIYPADLIEYICCRFPDPDAGRRDDDYSAANGPGIYRVTWVDIANTKWPQRSATKIMQRV